jgi:tRNA1Val (adenine37-N6)-methyltransferase
MADDSYTTDTLKGGEVRIFQPKKGYRFSIDAVLLAHFVNPKKREGTLLELGAGSGVVSFLLAHLHPHLNITAVEYQEELAHLAEMGVEENRLGGRMRVMPGDVREMEKLVPRESFSLVCANPPYRERGGGRIPPQEGRRLARHEFVLSQRELLSAITYALAPGGRAFIIYSARRMGELFSALGEHNLQAKRLRLVHPYKDKPANLFLLEMNKGGGVELTVEPPLYVWAGAGEYGAEVAGMM